MSSTRIEVSSGVERARVVLGAGAVVPRLVERGPSSARIALVAGGALLLGGDEVSIEVDVGDGCTLDLEEIGGTVAYRADGRPSTWTVTVRVGRDASLAWAGLPFVVSDGAAVVRRMDVRLTGGGVALLRETLVLGRSGERGGWIDTTLAAGDDDGPILHERLVVEGGAPMVGVLGEHRVLDTVSALGFRPPPIGPAGTVLDLDEPGAVSRFLGADTHASPLDQTWSVWRDALSPVQLPTPVVVP